MKPALISGYIALLGFCASNSQAALKINEIYYNVTPQGGNQYVELKNTGAQTEYLDGKILTDEAGIGTEGVFQFPGVPGGTNLPVLAGARVVIAVDATLNTAGVNWECYAGGADFDNPGVSNLTLVSGSDDLGFFTGGDNCILASGADTTAPIDPASIIDAVNYGDAGEFAPLSASAPDAGPHGGSAPGQSLQRCPDGADWDYASRDDFFANDLTQGTTSLCQVPFLSIDDVSQPEGQLGTNPAVFRVTLQPASLTAVTVHLRSFDGTATAGADYLGITTQLVFGVGETNRLVSVGIISEFLPELNETFTLHLFSNTNAALADARGLGTILDDDGGFIAFTGSIIRVAGPGHALTSEWLTVPGKAYVLQGTTNFPAGAWVDIGGTVTAASVTMTGVDTQATGANRRIYRVLQFD